MTAEHSVILDLVLAVVGSLLIALLASAYTQFVIEKGMVAGYRLLQYGSPTRLSRDSGGIVMVTYKGIGAQYNPVAVGHQGLGHFERFARHGRGEDRDIVLQCGQWFVDHARDYGGYTVWEYGFPWDRLGLTPPWRSAMAQGLGVQVLVKAYSISHEERYLDTLRSALGSFYVDVADGGVTLKDDKGWWFEEYAGDGVSSRVLNGHIYAMLGLHEVYQELNDERAMDLFERGKQALKNHLHEYDSGSWTYYDALGHVASQHYHSLHVHQMQQLHGIANDRVFQDCACRWRAYGRRPFFKTLIANPSRLNLAILGVNWLLCFLLCGAILALTRLL